MNKEASTYLVIPPLVSVDSRRLTLVLDLDETLAFGRHGPIIRRPYLDMLLETLGRHNVEVVVWTAGVRGYAQRLVAAIDPRGVIQHCVYRHEKWYPKCPEAGYTKNLALTGRHPDRTLIVDNTPDCLMRNARNGIVCADFVGRRDGDVTLLALRDIISELLCSDTPVPSFLDECEDLRLLSVLDSAGDTYEAYFLDTSRWGGSGLDGDPEVLRKTSRDWHNRDASPARCSSARSVAQTQRSAPTPGGSHLYSEIT